jgi:hypothetical protein
MSDFAMLPDPNRSSIWAGELETAIGLKLGASRSGGGFPNAGYEPHPTCGDSARSRPTRAAKISRKIIVGQQ